MIIELTAYDRPARLVSTTYLSSADIRGTLAFGPDPTGTRMRWSWEVEPKGLARLLTPFIARLGKRQEEAIWTDVKRILEEPQTP